MDHLELINLQIAAETATTCEAAGAIPIGEIAGRLECANGDQVVRFSDGESPGELMSYRGYYRLLAVDRVSAYVGALEFAARLNSAIGVAFEGYKGGDFTMPRTSPLWVSPWGECSGLGVVGVEVDEDGAVLVVAQLEAE